MDTFKRILVPIDLSAYCESAIGLASQLAAGNRAAIVFCFVGPPELPAEARFSQRELDRIIAQERRQFEKILPADSEVPYEHVFVQGSPGPEIVRLAAEQSCDLIVMATHGRRGFLRWALGSVAEYVIRHATCPVVSLKIPGTQEMAARPPSPWERVNPVQGAAADPTAGLPAGSAGETSPSRENSPGDDIQQAACFVTSAMSHVPPVIGTDPMSEVIAELVAAGSTAAPVVDVSGQCIGILTEADIAEFQELARRWNQKDASVMDEVFDVDEFGMRRSSSHSFYQVKKHMSSPVVTVSNQATCREAEQLFEHHQGLHHLIVVDEQDRPLGVLAKQQLQRIQPNESTA